MKKFLGVILARGGSKGLPGKNIRPLNGKPLIAYSIEGALKCKELDRVIVTTDSREIAEVSKSYGAEVPFMRPSHLAKDTTHTPPVIIHAVKQLEKNGYYPDYVVTLQPTSPLRKAEHISLGIKTILKTKSESLMSVKEAEFPPFWLVEYKNKRLYPFVKSKTDYFCLERQQLPKVYQPNGAVYITKTSALLKRRVLITKDCSAIIMDHTSSLDIDTALDFEFIESVLKNKQNNV
ncbi:MAG: acylneuraminate cytidylyltransferase family protein [Candidatus Aenigmatarchaeota archaeon]